MSTLRTAWQLRRSRSAYSKAALMITTVVAAALVVLTMAGASVRPADAVLVYFLLTIIVAATFGFRAGIVAALISDLILVYFFFAPIFVFWAEDAQHMAALGLFLLASAVGGLLLEQDKPASQSIHEPARPLPAADALDSAPETMPEVMRIDTAGHLAYVDGHEVDLTPTEFKLLQFFDANSGRVIRHEAILSAVWGEQYGSDVQILRTYVKQLRAKLGDDPASPRFIRTEPGIGYRFLPPTT